MVSSYILSDLDRLNLRKLARSVILIVKKGEI
jgi:hypothetical protein